MELIWVQKKIYTENGGVDLERRRGFIYLKTKKIKIKKAPHQNHFCLQNERRNVDIEIKSVAGD